ncbi:unnamed protein product [Arctogadus glacialis]
MCILVVPDRSLPLLQQSQDPVQGVPDRLEQTLDPRCVLREAGASSSLPLQHHLVLEDESTNQQRQVAAALSPLPSPSMLQHQL